jgi:hypothetical protein
MIATLGRAALHLARAAQHWTTRRALGAVYGAAFGGGEPIAEAMRAALAEGLAARAAAARWLGLESSAPAIALAWDAGASLAFECVADECGRRQSCAPDGVPGGITAEQAIRVGWTFGVDGWRCPVCSRAPASSSAAA